MKVVQKGIRLEMGRDYERAITYAALLLSSKWYIVIQQVILINPDLRVNHEQLFIKLGSNGR